ncbi:hypothetical protein V1511DRAFT_376156 [Dipodascopsis uninucleata]
MSSSEPINANPTIRAVEDLPTRLGKSSSREGVMKGIPASALDNVALPVSSNSLYTNLLLLDDNEILDVDMPDLVIDESSSGEEEDLEITDSEDRNEKSENTEGEEEIIDEQEIFDLISSISDPEHPVTLGQLAVVNKQDIYIKKLGAAGGISKVTVEITPTITHCSLATLIGLGIRVRLERCLPPRFRIEIKVKRGTHQSEGQVNKQLNDKERVAAACENAQLLGVVRGMLATCK